SNTTAEAGPTEGQIADPTEGQIAGQIDRPAADSCDAAPFRRLIGKPDSVFHVMDLPETVRLIHPGTPVTRDHRPARVNIEIDASGTIVKVWCG
ncbi:I78 family peptidase inhibitor, partial [Rhodalgimonas zhirmunskyi]